LLPMASFELDNRTGSMRCCPFTAFLRDFVTFIILLWCALRICPIVFTPLTRLQCCLSLLEHISKHCRLLTELYPLSPPNILRSLHSSLTILHATLRPQPCSSGSSDQQFCIHASRQPTLFPPQWRQSSKIGTRFCNLAADWICERSCKL
jgi:hypothetical protein